RDPRGGAAGAGARAEGRLRPPVPPEPPAGEHRGRAAVLREGADPGDEHGAAGEDGPGRVPGAGGGVQQGGGAPHRAGGAGERDHAEDRVNDGGNGQVGGNGGGGPVRGGGAGGPVATLSKE